MDYLIPKDEDLIFHYTNISAMMGIVTGKKLWATNLNYMNDASELRHGLRLLHQLVDEQLQSSDDQEKLFLNHFRKWSENINQNPHHIFAICLTKQGNLLSQWRGYTKYGKGVCVGFNKNALFELANEQNYIAADCEYELDKHKKIVKKCFDEIYGYYLNRLKSVITDNSSFYRSALDYLNGKTPDLLLAFSRLKHSSFSEEEEIRLISKYYEHYSDPDVKFREGASMLIPYIEFDISGLERCGPLFAKTIVGPSPNGQVAYLSIAHYLSNKKACNAVGPCNIPYRE